MLFRFVVDRGVGKRRSHDKRVDYPLSSLLECFQCSRHDEHVSYGESGVTVPPFGCTFSTAPGQSSTLAVANEEGIVSLYNTEKRSTVLKEWLAHDNAVFDIAWVPGANSLVTASGDQTARLWDVISGELLGSFKGHQCSLKSVAFPKQEKAVFCTGGRDGNIMLWDMRCSKKDGFYRQMKQISGAHMKMVRNTPQTKKKRVPSRGMAPSVDSQRGVTAVLFRDENTLISSGAVDGMIKMWDLRKSYTAYQQNPTPLQSYHYPGTSTRKLGYSGLTLDSTSSRLFCSCTDDNIYMFDISGSRTTSVAVFSGHRNSSFYVKSSVSPDDQFLASGSSDGHAYIWKISDPAQAPVMLQGHSQEVTSVTWSHSDFTKIATCSDDNTVRIWRLSRSVDGAAGNLNLIGWARRKIQTPSRPSGGPFPLTEGTPVRSSRSGRDDSLLSPRPGSCAPSVADFPPPSVTSSPTDTLCPPQNKTPLSVPVVTTLSSERRAKRRLDTSETTAGEDESDGVSELYLDCKRSRGSASAFCPSTVERTEQKEERISSSVQADKENSSPLKADWLSAMSRKLKQSQSGATFSKSPNAGKRQDSRTQSLSVLSSQQSGKKSSSPQAKRISSPASMKKISAYFQKTAQD
ncbi:denticleless protein homolog [Neoarius graeffei]|uniref:denticleless protein homolog n=1 Tax=Neoarius graeffei TaxID=443677 RepID=UPI00298D3340|nr:denticleless protein homolog [Neoarius graeffei]